MGSAKATNPSIEFKNYTFKIVATYHMGQWVKADD